MIGFGSLVGPLSHSVLYLLGVLTRHSPSSDFGENQLSRGLISLSLLLSSHLRIFQHPRVRSFIVCYHNFNLLKSRSPPLRVYCQRLAVTQPILNPPPRRRAGGAGPGSEWAGLRHIVGSWFQVLFHSPSRGSFHLSLAVLVHYRLPRSI